MRFIEKLMLFASSEMTFLLSVTMLQLQLTLGTQAQPAPLVILEEVL